MVVSGWARGWVPVAVLALAGCGGGGDGSATGGVSGYVYARDGVLAVYGTADQARAGELPVASALVSIARGGVALSQADGSFQIVGVDPGQHTLRVDVAGSTAVTVTVTVVAGTVTPVGGTAPVTRQWTVMVYLNADNDREAAGVATVNALESVVNSGEVTVDVLMDRAVGRDTSNGDWTGARRFTIVHDTDPQVTTSTLLASQGGGAEDLGEMDLGLPATLLSFVRDSAGKYPASRYCLIVWGTGTSWRPAGRAVSFDESGSAIATGDLKNALPLSPKLDLVAFDADLMQTLEVAYEIRSRCQVVAGSQGTMPPDGFAWPAWLTALVSQPTLTAEDAAKRLVSETVDAGADRFEVALSAVRTAKLSDLATALSNFAGRLRELGAERHADLAAARSATQRYGGTDARYDGLRDLRDFVERVTESLGDGTLNTLRAPLLAALTAAVVETRHTGSGVAGSHGLTIYFPDRADFLGPGVAGEAATEEAYGHLSLSSDTVWDDWLEDFCRRQ